jgi:hypothetical protein
MKEEEFKNSATYRDWSPGERTTFNALLDVYRKLRIKVGPFVYITRNMLKDAYGTAHVGTASKFQGHIEEIENDQPPRGRRAAAAPQPDSSEPPPAAIQTAFEGVQKALEAALNAVLEWRAREGQELSHQHQRLQREYLAAADAREQALSERIADLEKASAGAGEESWDHAAAIDEMRPALQAVTSERDAEKKRADQAMAALDAETAKVAIAQASVETCQERVNSQAVQLARLLQEQAGWQMATERAAELAAENAGLRERAAAFEDRAVGLEELLAEMDERNAREREAMRVAHEAVLAEERGRTAEREAKLLAWFGAPVHREGERD